MHRRMRRADRDFKRWRFSQVDRTKKFRYVNQSLFGCFPLFILIGFSFDPGSSIEAVQRWENAVRWMESALPVVRNCGAAIVFLWFTVLLPMSIFRSMHPLIAVALKISSFIIGGVCWWQSFIVTYRMLGWLSVVIGLLFAGLGVVPMALVATGMRGDRDVFGDLLLGAGLTLLPRYAAKFMTNRPAEMPDAEKLKSYGVDD